MDIVSYMDEVRESVNRSLDRYLEEYKAHPLLIHEAMGYSVKAGGKRLRPILAIAAADLVGGDSERVMPLACALEFVHTFSLIHDDLPAMDNDDLRRGKPTNHKVFGEAVAILAGDGLLVLAFSILLAQDFVRLVSKDTALKIACEVAEAVGVHGMIGGQILDMQSEGKKLKLNELEELHALKTGKLIAASVVCGAMAGGATPSQLDTLKKYGRKIGLAFQVVDDILDVVGNQEALGKSVGSDADNKKATFPSLLGIDGSVDMVRRLRLEALKELEVFAEKAEVLRGITDFIVQRTF